MERSCTPGMDDKSWRLSARRSNPVAELITGPTTIPSWIECVRVSKQSGCHKNQLRARKVVRNPKSRAAECGRTTRLVGGSWAQEWRVSQLGIGRGTWKPGLEPGLLSAGTPRRTSAMTKNLHIHKAP